MRFKLTIIGATMLGAGVVWTFPAANAAPKEKSTPAASEAKSSNVRTFPLVATYDEPPDTPDGVGCNNLGLPTPTVGTDTCRIYLKGASAFKGGIEGIETYNLGTWPDTRGGVGNLRVGLGYEGPVTFVDATVHCGTTLLKGTFQMQVSDGFLDSTSYNPTTGESQGYNLWRVLPATATGELAGRLLGGSGETNWTNHPLSNSNDFGVGTFTGTLTCAVGR